MREGRNKIFCKSYFWPKARRLLGSRGPKGPAEPSITNDSRFKLLLLQEQSSFAKDCKKKGGFFKCCIQAFTLNIFETSRKSLIEEGLIKDKPTSYCKPGWERRDPCLTCHTDAMCTEMDILTGQTKHTFMKGYKAEHRVMKRGLLTFICSS